MPLPAITWLAYAVTAYIGWTVYFRVRYGRSAVKERFPPRNLYGWIDFALGVCLIAYSVWIVFGPEPRPVGGEPGKWAGLAVFALGAGLRLWAVLTLGPNWRIGQDEADTEATFVATGPYRIMRHPINTALVIIAIGQALMVGLADPRSMFLLAFSTAYLFAQARAEERFWKQRRAAAPAARATAGETV